jgi:hypothetical protein
MVSPLLALRAGMGNGNEGAEFVKEARSGEISSFSFSMDGSGTEFA